LAERFHVSRPTIYDVLKRARLQEFVPRNSTNQRFKTLQYGLKRLAKIEQTIQERLKREAKRYNKSYPGELVHFSEFMSQKERQLKIILRKMELREHWGVSSTH
jgi:esterase/lipase